ncbi:MAG: box helicase protein [Thermoleophilaceae bacterium]|jgi:DEAD/DEAH box helicase domain-containing protein|nr:box helicase protein [Thermoleophilaceae bacterium]
MAIARLKTPWEDVLEAGRGDQLVTTAREGAKPATVSPVPEDLHPMLRAALQRTGVDQLYSHQADTLEAAQRGHVIVTTGTASGKSLAFNLPVLDTLAHDPRARALYLYPTKALAQDQARKLGQLGAGFLRHAIYDGDTPQEDRRAIRARSNLILSNPDMLNMGVLPNHKAWGDVLANLAWVVIDEAHVYRGVFGSHVANVLRRLRRLANAYGTEPRFILTSATIANAPELAEELTGLDFQLVDRDGAPHAERQIAIWNPPLTDEATGARTSALSEAARLLADLVEREVRTICFLKSRRGVELIQSFARQRLESNGRGDLAERIAPYRAGYTPQQRRELEGRLASGELLAVAATDALELGIDVGDLDAAICVTFPGTVASLRQMWGRAGRRNKGLALYVAGDDALDQFFCRHPDEFLSRPVEAAILDHESEEIHRAHLVAAAYEMPLSPGDAETLGPRWEAYAEQLVRKGMLRERGGQYTVRQEGFPAGDISLRSSSTASFAILDVTSGELMGTVEAARAPSTVHPGAVYLHMGRAFEVEELDLANRRAAVRPFEGDWYTQPKKEAETWIESVRDQREVYGVKLSFGVVSVTEEVIAFQRKRMSDHEAIDLQPVDLPPQSFVTQALWYELPDEMFRADFPLDQLLGALHAAEHTQIAVLPLIAMCDRWDIGGLSTNHHAQTGRPTIFIYDGHPGGVGITRTGFREFETLVDDAARLIAECPCRRGCPSCVQSPKCGNLNEPLSKGGALELMGRMQGAAADNVATGA